MKVNSNKKLKSQPVNPVSQSSSQAVIQSGSHESQAVNKVCQLKLEIEPVVRKSKSQPIEKVSQLRKSASQQSEKINQRSNHKKIHFFKKS